MEPMIEQGMVDDLINAAALGLSVDEWVSGIDLYGTSILFKIKNKYNVLGRVEERLIQRG